MEIKPTYKELTNYLRNELGITREYIAEVVEHSIKNTIKQYIEEKITESRLDREVGSAVVAFVTDNRSDWRSGSTKEKFDKAVLSEVKKAVGKLLEKDFDVEFSIKTKPKSEVSHESLV